MYEFARNIDISKLSPVRNEREISVRSTMEALDLPLEIEGKPFHFKLVLGNVMDAQTDTLLCPINGRFRNELARSAADAISEQAGKIPFERARRYVLRKTHPQEKREVPFGTARAVSSGDLEQKGIHHIVFSNVYGSTHDPLSFDRIALIVGNALEETDRVQGKTLAIPLLGTREIFDSVPHWESIAGTIAGIGVYQEKLQHTIFPQRTVEALSLVAAYHPTTESREVGEKLVLEAIQEVKDRVLGWNPFGAGSDDSF